MIDPPALVESEAQPAAVIRLTIPRDEIQEVMGPAIQEILHAVAAQGMVPAGPVFSHHFKMEPDTFDFEVGVPLTAPVSPAGRVLPGQLPAATVVRTIYTGPYEGLGAAWSEFMEWIGTTGHATAPDLWECYLNGPESSPDPTTWRTELNRPVIS